MSALEDLFARAGASDEDREAWLAERREGITATEVAKLAKSPAAEVEIRREKAGESTFHGNRYTDWGKAREPHLAAYARGFGLEPESRVFHSETDSRFLASPDAVGLNFDDEVFLGEIKTSKHDLNPDKEYFWTTTYYDQMQWQMFVTGAVECVFIWEQHDDGWPAPTVFPVRHKWMQREDPRIVELIEVANRFLDGGEKPQVEAWQAHYLDAKSDKEEAQSRMDEAAAALRGLFPDGGAVETPLGKVSVSFPKPSKRFDSTAFKAAEPDLYKQYQKESPAGEPRVTVTPVKEKVNE